MPQADSSGAVTADEFAALFRTVSAWGRCGDDQRGALHHLGREQVAAAAALVRDGITVSLSLPPATEAADSHPEPADHHMTMLADEDIGSGSLRFAKDWVGVDYHTDGHSHIDALCHVAYAGYHVAYAGYLYNGQPPDAVTADGAAVEAIGVLKAGLVGRGVLLDVPRLRGVPWLEPGEHVFRDDLEAAERTQGVRAGKGDILLVRTGHARRLQELGARDTTTAKAGLHPTAMPFVAERAVAALGSDGNSDTASSSTEGVAFPIHVLALNAMGVHLLDYLQFDDLVDRCEEAGRWEFLFVAAPLRIPRGTGSPLNPIAVF